MLYIVQVQALEEENKQLVRNISCLFKTAQAEIYRKDSEIQKLRQQLRQSEISKATSTTG